MTNGQIKRDELDGMALASFILLDALLANLRGHGIDVDRLLEIGLSGLENYLDPSDPAARKARVLVEALAHRIRHNRPP